MHQRGRIDVDNHICSKIHHHSFNSSNTTIYQSSSCHPKELPATFGKKTPHTGSNFLSKPISPSLPTLILSSPEPRPVSIFLKPLLTLTWVSKKKYHYYLKIPYPIHFDLCRPIWLELIRKLQMVQNPALCVTNGCVKMISIDHVHEETKVFPIHDHLSLICSQYLVRIFQPNNSSYNVVISFSIYRKMKTPSKLGSCIVLLRICRTIFFS